MFAKCVLRVEQRGVRHVQAYARAKNRLDRWVMGDKMGLWREVAKEDALKRAKKKKKGVVSKEVREERVSKLTGLRLLSKAIQAIISPGVAQDTPKVESKLCSKFPARAREVIDPGVLPAAVPKNQDSSW